MKKIKSDLLAMNVSWFIDDLELYENQFLGFVESFSFTVARFVTLILAILVHKAFYNLMKRLPGRAVNQIIYPSMVRFQFFTRCLSQGIYFCVMRRFQCSHLVSQLHQLFPVKLTFNLRFFFRFWSPHVWGLSHCTSHLSIGCIPWKTSLENQAVIFSSTWGLWELLQYNFNLFSWLRIATFAFYMMIFYSDSTWDLKWVYIFLHLS
jgi:hypothetical protein